MDERSFERWRRCLLVVCGSMVLFGVGLVVLDTRVLAGVSFTERLSESLWGQPHLPEGVVTYHRFVHAASA